MRNSIIHTKFATKILLGIFVPLIMVCITLGVYMVHRIDTDSQRRLDEKGNTLNTLLAKISVIPIITYDYWSLEDYIKVALRDAEVMYAVIYDEHELAITHSSSKPEKTGDPSIKTYTTPIVHNERTIGRVEIGISTISYQKGIRRDAAFFLFIVLVTLTLGFMLSFFVSNTVTKPVKKIVHVMKEAEQGDFTVRAPINSRDEIGALAEGFNEMLGQIQKRDAELELHRRNLEDIVTTRTAELERTNAQLQHELVEHGHTEEALKKLTVKLQESNRELQDFAHIASHDLQEPLRKVMAFGDRLQEQFGSTLGDQGKDYLERMQNATMRMQTLIDSLLTYSRVTTKARPFAPVDLGAVVREVLSDLEVRIQQTGGRVEVGDLITLDADPMQMRQLFQNLIGNALKFHKREEPPVVKINGMLVHAPINNIDRHSGGINFYQITVEDNGIGFDEKHADGIFGVFQRLHGRNEYEGSGVGLAICKKIVECYGGAIVARSVPEQGAAFIVTLPVKQPEREDA